MDFLYASGQTTDVRKPSGRCRKCRDSHAEITNETMTRASLTKCRQIMLMQIYTVAYSIQSYFRHLLLKFFGESVSCLILTAGKLVIKRIYKFLSSFSNLPDRPNPLYRFCGKRDGLRKNGQGYPFPAWSIRRSSSKPISRI